MIEHVWTVVCSRVVIDRESNNASLQNVVDQINVQGEIAAGTLLAVPFEIVSLWIRTDPEEAGTGEARVSLIAPSDKQLGSFDYPISLSDHERHRGVLRSQGLIYEGPGRYTYRVELRVDPQGEWRQVAAVPVTVVVTPATE